MEYRQLGRSGLKISTLTLGTMTIGGKGPFAKVGNAGRRRGKAADRPVPRRRRQPDRHGGRLFDRRLRGDHRRGAGRQAQGRRADRHQGALPHGRRAQRPRPVAPLPDPRLRGEPEAAQDRRHRPLPGPSMGRADAARGDAGRARHAGAAGQGALRRLLQLFGLAHHEGARRQRGRGQAALRQPADPLHAGGARGRVRAGADRHRPGARHPGLEPAGGRPAVGQAPPRPGHARKAPGSSPAGTSRRSATRSGCGGSSTRWSRSPRRATSRRRASRSPGCSAGRR